MIIKQEFMPVGHRSRPGLPMNHPTSITIHWIGPYPNQQPMDPRAWWLKGPDGQGLAASAHYIVKDDKCVQCIPENEVAWHTGGKGNYSSIGIEVIPMNKMGEFSLDTIETLIKLLKQLPKLELKRHYDWTQKDCPRYYTPIQTLTGAEGRVENPPGGEARWEELKAQLEEGRREDE